MKLRKDAIICPHGIIPMRKCSRCRSERAKQWRKTHPDKRNRRDYNREYSKKYRKIHPECRIREKFGSDAAKFWLDHFKEGCKKCGIYTTLSLHHIDRNKKNNSETNLVILCRKHHTELERYFDSEDRPILLKWFNNWISCSKSAESL